MKLFIHSNSTVFEIMRTDLLLFTVIFCWLLSFFFFLLILVYVPSGSLLLVPLFIRKDSFARRVRVSGF
jgi:xanthine/uracil/vitamin C permease (AzgA family)